MQPNHPESIYKQTLILTLNHNIIAPKAALKVVFVMSRKLAAAQMDASHLGGSRAKLVVNSNLVSLAIVTDDKFNFAPFQLDLAEPIRLTFAHLDAASGLGGRHRRHLCAHLDANGEWQAEGCELAQTNATHSTCACKHLSTFALLSSADWEPSQQPGEVATDVGVAGAQAKVSLAACK